MQAIHKLEPCPSAAGSQKAESNPRLPSRSQASWCELMALMAVRAPTVNRDLARTFGNWQLQQEIRELEKTADAVTAECGN